MTRRQIFVVLLFAAAAAAAPAARKSLSAFVVRALAEPLPLVEDTEFVKTFSGPRSSTFVLLVSDSSSRCSSCPGTEEAVRYTARQFALQQDVIEAKYAAVPAKERVKTRDRPVEDRAVFFFRVDVSDPACANVVQILTRSGVKAVPSILHFPPHAQSGIGQFHLDDHWHKSGMDGRWLFSYMKRIFRKDKLPIVLSSAQRRNRVILLSALASTGLAILFFLFSRRSPLSSKWFWFGVSCVLLYVTISGVIYNLVASPYLMRASMFYVTSAYLQRPGEFPYIAPNLRSQYPWEGFLIGCFFALCSTGCLVLSHTVPRIRNPWKRRLVGYSALAVTIFSGACVFYAFTVSKNPTYNAIESGMKQSVIGQRLHVIVERSVFEPGRQFLRETSLRASEHAEGLLRSALGEIHSRADRHLGVDLLRN